MHMHETFVFISFKLAIFTIAFDIPQNSYAILGRALRRQQASKTGAFVLCIAALASVHGRVLKRKSTIQL